VGSEPEVGSRYSVAREEVNREEGEIVGRKPGKIGLSAMGYAFLPLSHQAISLSSHKSKRFAHGLTWIFTEADDLLSFAAQFIRRII